MCPGCPRNAFGDTREVSFKMLPVMPLVPMDLVLMTQVLVNLLENSLKYSPAGSLIEVVASTEAAVAGAGSGRPGPRRAGT